MNLLNTPLFLWLQVVLWCAIIFTLSHIPSLRIEAFGIWDFFLRKLAHITEFGILFGLIYRALKRSTKWYNQHNLSRLLFWSAFLSFIYAVSDEFHQLFIPGRTPAVLDVLIDSTGILIMFVIIKFRAIGLEGKK
ncbi:MAG: hypothetical protein A2252_00920 [Elusimicrobia bacterium RIFOXYA2_FULL_39_19]|nr:MAG: hypothetical protein A2252_00920 [Elusimicrobia bacterium RIFOXYA2_FULL_39_19]